MGLFGFLKSGNKDNSASKAKNRLLVTLEYDRNFNQEFPYIDELKADIMELIKKYEEVDRVNVENNDNNDIEIEVILKK